VRIEVVYCARPGEADIRELDLPAPLTVRDALAASGLLEAHPRIDLARQRVGIWGRRCRLEDSVREGDRIEVYRPLSVDPKEARRLRYRAQKAGRRG
jgi:putative ubiquitin-RnfH superfamily antitoxin RatB of RatAB toxin-antitoxin module